MWGVNHPAETSAPSASGGVASVGGGITSTGDAGSATTSAAPAGGASAGASAPAADVTSTASAAAGCCLPAFSHVCCGGGVVRDPYLTTHNSDSADRSGMGMRYRIRSYHLACSLLKRHT